MSHSNGPSLSKAPHPLTLSARTIGLIKALVNKSFTTYDALFFSFAHTSCTLFKGSNPRNYFGINSLLLCWACYAKDLKPGIWFELKGL
jgi:hypothetical protein